MSNKTQDLAIHRSPSQSSLGGPGKPDIANGEVVHSASGHLDAVYGVGGVGHTQRRLKARHVTFIGFGGGIGTGLFIGTGAALANAGPLGLLLAYSVVGLLLWCVMESIGELATLFPTAGSFPHFATRFVDPALGFTLAISYGYCYTIAIASEVSAAAIVVSYWTDITPAVVITIGLVAIFLINMANVKFYGEAEVITASIKILCFLVLIIVSLVITAGGAPNHETIGFRYWKDPGPFVPFDGITGNKGNFLAFFSAFINASFSYIGVETVVVAAAETVNPHKAIPKAVKRVTYRILFFYVLGTLLIGMIIPSNDPGLVSGSGNANSSPFVIAIKNSGISVLPSIINACILTSAWSAGNSYCYIGARMIVAMAVDRQAPQCFAKVNRWGVPYYAVLVSFAFGPLAYLSLGSGGAAQAFTWLLNLSTVAGLLAWMTLCICYIRYHHACLAQGVNRDNLPFKGRCQPLAAYVGAIGSGIIVIFSGFGVFVKGNWNTANFIASYIGIVIYIAPYVFWKIFKRTSVSRSKDVDLFSGRFDASCAPVEPIPTTAWGRFLDWLF
ncbi:365d4655-ee32-4306-a641-3e206babaf03 [Sclerotinia trifoliorum]|uniref:365d4655-ee32-4306-a641-3e206babaf03 n=1 Tax=Sclerotinia trifoliorum TaxID=28548 RepID=A0A8H2ZMW6_9HELO|nr:365d4655-ee32-4306-a641-3e206babaf03 [Sclerotinia trifoliorum]